MTSENFPHPIPCVRIVVLNDANRILILQRSENTFRSGGWCLPGGKADYGELFLESARRELLEETGLVATSSELIGFQESLPLESGSMHAVNFYYLCKATGEVVLNEKESMAYYWKTPRELLAMTLEFGNGWGVQELVRRKMI